MTGRLQALVFFQRGDAGWAVDLRITIRILQYKKDGVAGSHTVQIDAFGRNHR